MLPHFSIPPRAKLPQGRKIINLKKVESPHDCMHIYIHVRLPKWDSGGTGAKVSFAGTSRRGAISRDEEQLPAFVNTCRIARISRTRSCPSQFAVKLFAAIGLSFIPRWAKSTRTDVGDDARRSCCVHATFFFSRRLMEIRRIHDFYLKFFFYFRVQI